MRARLPTLALLLLAAGCRFAPEGSCSTDGDCVPGRHCSADVCVPDGRSTLYSACVVDRDCDPYALCKRNVCVLAPGACTEVLDCQAWESCEFNACRPLAGRCGTLDDCEVWQFCNAAHSCVPSAGRCGVPADCEAWQTCTPERFCVASAGYCATTLDCADPLDVCDATHACSLRPGACRTQDDCPAAEVCLANACTAQAAPPTLDPAAVFLAGTLAPGSPDRGAIAPLSAPLSRLVGLAAGDGVCGARIDPAGAVLLSRGAASLATLAPDAILWDAGLGAWVYPPDPGAGDAAVALPAACAAALSVSFVAQPGTGERLFDCGDGDWRDDTGAVVVPAQPLLAWNAGDLKLVGSSGMVTPPILLDGTGTAVAVGAPVSDPARLLAGWRADGTGFRLVLTTDLVAQLVDLEVWTLDQAGVAALVGALPALPAAVTAVGEPTLDAAGAVYQLGVTATGDVVVKRTPGGAAELVYDEATLPPATSLLDQPVLVDSASSCLVTGP